MSLLRLPEVLGEGTLRAEGPMQGGDRGGYLGSDPDLESPSVFRMGFLDTRPQEDSDAFTKHFLWPAPWPRPQASSRLSSSVYGGSCHPT